MSDQEKDLFETVSGLPLAGANVTVIEAQFEFNNEYAKNSDTTPCVLSLTYRNDDDDSAEPRAQLYSTGKNYEPVEQGDAVAHTSGKVVQFSNQSNYGKLITSTIKNCPEFRAYAQQKGIQPDRAELWLGAKFKLGTLEYKPMGWKEGDNLKELIVPVEYYGHEQDETPAKATGATKKAAAPKASDVDDDVRTKLLELAQSTDDYDDYLEKLMEFAEGDKAIEKAGMGQKAGSVWTEAHN